MALEACTTPRGISHMPSVALWTQTALEAVPCLVDVEGSHVRRYGHVMSARLLI